MSTTHVRMQVEYINLRADKFCSFVFKFCNITWRICFVFIKL